MQRLKRLVVLSSICSRHAKKLFPRNANNHYGVTSLRINSNSLISNASTRSFLICLHNRKWEYHSFDRLKLSACLSALSAIAFIAIQDERFSCEAEAKDERGFDGLGFKYFTKKEVAKHKTKETGIWVTYKDGVYDVTNFIDSHPGGDRIMLAAGSAIDPFWAMYNQHLTKQVLDILVELRIGTLKPGEEIDNVDNYADPYAKEPERFSALPIRANKPYNAETISELIPDNYITPTAMHYKRHHHPVPDVNSDSYRLVVAHEDDNIMQISLKELKSEFKKQVFPVTLQCAGNRRKELLDVGQCQGLHWETGAVSTANWGGVYLRELLEYCGLGDDSTLLERTGAKHVHFEGMDEPYDASIPIEKALGSFGDVLVAYEMNGEPIPRDSGGPVRMIVPGHLAARSVKWLKRIAVSREESHSTWQRGFAYKGMPSSVKSFENVDSGDYLSVQELPVQSAICSPKPDAYIDPEDDEIEVKGWAWSGGGRNIARVSVNADFKDYVSYDKVELSLDGGKTWTQAQLKSGNDQPYNRAWAWTLWEVKLEVSKELRKPGNTIELCVKAIDRSFNQQPERADLVWNLRGIMNNSWHRIKLHVKSDDNPVEP